MKCAGVLLFVAGAAGLWAQIGYPGGYPPGGYPGPGGGPGIPMPRRGKKGSGSNDPAQKVTEVAGKLSRVEPKRLVVDVPDGRIVEFVRTEKTKILRDEEAADPASLKVGDRVTVEGTEDADGIVTATTVRIEQPAAPPAESAKDEPAKPEALPAPATSDAPESTRDPDDPGPPSLKHGAQPRKASESADTIEVPSEPIEKKEEEPEPPANEEPDPLIEKARSAAANFTAGLPNYVCKEFMARYMSVKRPVDWQALDVVSTEVVYEGSKETYRNVAINGKATHKPLEEIGGSWSTGEFASTLLDVLSPSTAAEFRPRGDDTIEGTAVRVYNFTVERLHSHWLVKGPAQSIYPAYRGAIWIDPKNGRVLRIEMGARKLPEEFTFDTVESAVDYGSVRLGEREFLLPIHAESLSCQRGTSNCSRNTIDFRTYHKFGSESDITYDTSKK